MRIGDWSSDVCSSDLIAMIGRGVNQSKPDMEGEGRNQLAVANIENEILLGRHLLSAAERRKLSEMLLVLDATATAEDYTAAATETNAEAIQDRKSVAEGKRGEGGGDLGGRRTI